MTSSRPETENANHWLNRDVLGMGIASFFSDLGHEMATAALPAFLITLGAAPLALGTIEGVSDAVSSSVKLLSGWLSDKTGKRKPIAVLGYFFTAIFTGTLGFTTSWPQVLASRSAAWFGRGIRGPARDALLAESVQPRAYGRAFGFHRAADTLGAVAGPLAAALLIPLFTYRELFWITFVPGVLATAAFAFMVRERMQSPGHGMHFIASIRSLPTRFRIFLVAVGVFGIGDFAHSLLILRATQVLTPTLGAARAAHVAIILYVVHNILYAGFAFPVGALGDRISKRSILAVGYLVGAVMAGILAVHTPGIWVLGLVFVLGGILLAVEDAMEGAIAADLLPGHIRGVGYGALSTMNGIGDFVSSLIVGALWTAVSPSAGFAYAAALMGLGALLMWRIVAS